MQDKTDIRVECHYEARLKNVRLCNVSAPFMRAKTQVSPLSNPPHTTHSHTVTGCPHRDSDLKHTGINITCYIFNLNIESAFSANNIHYLICSFQHIHHLLWNTFMQQERRGATKNL